VALTPCRHLEQGRVLTASAGSFLQVVTVERQLLVVIDHLLETGSIDVMVRQAL